MRRTVHLPNHIYIDVYIHTYVCVYMYFTNYKGKATVLKCIIAFKLLSYISLLCNWS